MIKYTLPFLLLLSFHQSLAQIFPLSARQYVTELQTHAEQNFSSDALLVQVLFHRFQFRATVVRYDIPYGIANGWFYRYFSPSLSRYSVFYAYRNLSLNLVIEPAPSGATLPPFFGRNPLSDIWLDSPLSNEAALDAGARAFVQAHPDVVVTRATVDSLTPGTGLNGMLWTFIFVDGQDSLICRVDASTGKSAECGPPSTTSLEALVLPLPLELHDIRPHPLRENSSAVIPFRLESPGFVELHVFDLFGRIAASLLSDYTAEGTHLVKWKPDSLPPGMYVLRLSSGRKSVSKTLILK